MNQQALRAAAQVGIELPQDGNLTVALLKDLAKRLAQYAEEHMPGASGTEKKAYCVQQVLVIVEAYDDKIPTLAKWADVPVVDFLEEKIIGMLIDWGWLVVLGLKESENLKARVVSSDGISQPGYAG